MKGPWISFTARGKHGGGLLRSTTPTPPSKVTLEVPEITGRSIPKLERLTGAMIVLAPIVTAINGDSKKAIIHPTTNDGGTTLASTSQWSPDMSPLHSDLISPLSPSASIPPSYSIAALAQKPPKATAKRVTFTYEEKIAQHIAAQFYSTRDQQDFPQEKSCNPKLSPLLSAGRHDDLSNVSRVKRSPSPLPPLIAQPGLPELGGRDRRRAEKNCHHSWDGRSVLELDDSDSENGRLLGVPRYSLRYKKHAPHAPYAPYAQDSYRIFSNNRSILPLAGAGSVMRLPLQEIHQFKNATHLSQGPQFRVAPKVQSMAGDTIYVPVPHRAGSLHLSPTQCGLDSISITSTIYSFEHMYMSGPNTDYRNSVEFCGLSPPPPLPLTPLLPAHISGAVAGAMLGVEPEGPETSSSTSMADTVLTEGTVGSTDTLTTEKEIALEMERIRERAKRASVERKARRANEERQERENKGKGAVKGKGKEHNG